MRIGGLIAVGVADHGLLAIAGRPACFLHCAIAGGQNRRAARCSPVHAPVHLAEFQDGVPSCAEGRSKPGIGHYLAQQEFLRALAGFVVIVDAARLGVSEAVIFAGYIAKLDGGIQYLGIVCRFLLFIFKGNEQLQLIGG